MDLKVTFSETQHEFEVDFGEVLVVDEGGGVELPTLDFPGTADDLMTGKQLIDGEGNIVDGAFTLEDEVSEQDSLIDQIRVALKGKATAAPGLPTQEKSVEITKNGEHEVTPDDGYTLSKVGVSVNVPVPNGYIVPSGELEITENGKYDVTQYASVNVDVESSGGDSDLPAGYSQVDFIEFTGEQLVDTGIIGNQDTQIRTSFTWGNDKQNHVYGCASTDNTASITSYTNGSWRFGDKSATKTVQKNNTLLPYSTLVNKTMIGITGSMTSISDVPDFETVATLLLGGARTADGGLPASGIVGRVFEFRIWDGDTLAMDMIPVTDGTVFRFYDMVSRTFFDSITDTPLEGGNL